ncbi:hypothetical protein [Rhodothalassium salexigens]|uniref:hypothetical protein n=1 Tax=Rhodothalassium salexigens TaxID=1086 RepID=UPI001911781F|nr:hypothetical protein [Rhodothalassium salexigens]
METQTPTKPWYLSKTILGAIVTTLASLLQVFGVTLPATLQAEIADALLLVATAAGAVLTVVGRLTATRAIAKPKGPKGGTPAAALALALCLPALGACAVQEAQSPAQTVYALQADYAALQTAALAYIEGDGGTPADPAAVAAIRDADAAAMDALRAAVSGKKV